MRSLSISSAQSLTACPFLPQLKQIMRDVSYVRGPGRRLGAPVSDAFIDGDAVGRACGVVATMLTEDVFNNLSIFR